MTRFGLISFLFLLSGAPARGEETASFLKIGVGARPMATGQSIASIADGMDALTYNPAGLARVDARQAGMTHAQMIEETRLDFIGYAQPMAFSSGRRASLGLAMTYLSQGAIAGRDAQRRPTGSVGASDLSLQLAGGIAVTRNWNAGAGVRYIRSELAAAQASSFSLDLGAQWRSGAFQLGAAARNLGPGLKFSRETDDLPLTYSLGAGYQIPVAGLLLAADYKQRPHSGKSELSVGMELAPLPAVAIRGGYSARLGHDDSNSALAGSPALGGLGTGLGLKVLGSQLDYAFSPMGTLGSAHRISVSTKF